MKKWNGYETTQVMGGKKKLPVGAYVCKVLEAREESYGWGSVLVIHFDIAEGEYWYVNTYLDTFLKGILYFADFTFRMLLTLSLRGYDFLFLRGFLLLRTALKQAITTTLNINSALRHPVLQKSIILLIFFSILFR